MRLIREDPRAERERYAVLLAMAKSLAGSKSTIMSIYVFHTGRKPRGRKPLLPRIIV
jgi:hypothetical protein